MNSLVMIFIDEDGEKVENPVWCLRDPGADDAPRTLCEGMVWGEGEGSAVFKVKTAKRGGITCPNCLEKLNRYKSVKL